MSELRAIRGKKPKAMAEGHFLECDCIPQKNRSFVEVRTGIVKDAKGKVINRGTPMWACTQCGKLQD